MMRVSRAGLILLVVLGLSLAHVADAPGVSASTEQCRWLRYSESQVSHLKNGQFVSFTTDGAIATWVVRYIQEVDITYIEFCGTRLSFRTRTILRLDDYRFTLAGGIWTRWFEPLGTAGWTNDYFGHLQPKTKFQAAQESAPPNVQIVWWLSF
jgi:hypothetical protein